MCVVRSRQIRQEAPVPELRPVPERGMAAMGMSHEMGGMDMITTNEDQLGMDDHQEMSGGHGGHKAATQQRPSAPDLGIEHAPGGHGPGAAMIARNPVSRLNEPGIGLDNVDHRVLVYGDRDWRSLAR